MGIDSRNPRFGVGFGVSGPHFMSVVGIQRIIEPPMHIDSKLSSNIQFADWVAALVSRAIDYQLIQDSKYTWVTDRRALKTVRGAFTHESKLHLWERDLVDLNHSEIFLKKRLMYPVLEESHHRMGNAVGPAQFRKIKAAAERAQERDRQAHN